MPAGFGGNDDLIGGRYRALGRLAEGAWGAVYEALSPSGERVAVKVLRNAFAEGAERRRFEREGAILVGLDHPHIVRLYDYGISDDAPYLVFELLDGRTLAAELRRVGFMSATRVAALAKQILSALAHSHARGIVHRDIKPANLQLCRSTIVVDHVKVLDFGVAKAINHGRGAGIMEALTEPGAMVGSPGYMAPEQIRAGEATPAIDLFAVAVVMCELLDGAQLMGDTLLEICRQHMRRGPFELPRSVAASALGGVIARALAKNAADRFPSAEAMAMAIEDCIGVDDAPRSASGTVLLPEHLDSDVSPSSTIPLEDLPWLRSED